MKLRFGTGQRNVTNNETVREKQQNVTNKATVRQKKRHIILMDRSRDG